MAIIAHNHDLLFTFLMHVLYESIYNNFKEFYDY